VFAVLLSGFNSTFSFKHFVPPLFLLQESVAQDAQERGDLALDCLAGRQLAMGPSVQSGLLEMCEACLQSTPRCRLDMVNEHSYQPRGSYGSTMPRTVTLCHPNCVQQKFVPPITDACGYMRLVLKKTEAEIKEFRLQACGGQW
jgi:hypothetical protein